MKINLLIRLKNVIENIILKLLKKSKFFTGRLSERILLELLLE